MNEESFVASLAGVRRPSKGEQQDRPAPDLKSATVCLVVLSFNTRELVAQCLPSLLLACATSRAHARVALLDNGSRDGSVEFVQKQFPNIDIFVSPRNRVLCSFNDYLREIDDSYIVLLNSDVKVDPDFLDPLIETISADPDAVMASPRCYRFDGVTLEGGATRLRFQAGWFSASSRYPGFEQDLLRKTFNASAGAVMLVNREKFLALGGFDDLYRPGRLEDVDLFYRAWKSGFRAYYEPRSVAYHQGFGSFHKVFGEKRTRRMAFRNTWLFMWKNLSDPSFLIRHALWALPRIMLGLLRGNPDYLVGFLAALPRALEVLKRRRMLSGTWRRTDRDLMLLLGY